MEAKTEACASNESGAFQRGGECRTGKVNDTAANSLSEVPS